jgi:3-methyladenine DNA glycosylase AlkD
MHTYWAPLANQFEENADPVKALGMAKYMKDHFDFYGVSAPLRKELTRIHIKEHGFPPLEMLDAVMLVAWQLPREMQYSAVEVLVRMRKKLSPDHIPLLETLITTKSWWDTTDGIAPNVLGPILLEHDFLAGEKIVEWIDSGNLWLQRSAILYQLKYKQKLNRERLMLAIDAQMGSKEFFIRKAMGWMLREYAKTDKNWVVAFVASREELSNLTKREALKHL